MTGNRAGSAENEDALGGRRVSIGVGVLLLEEEARGAAGALRLVVADNDGLDGEARQGCDGVAVALDRRGSVITAMSSLTIVPWPWPSPTVAPVTLETLTKKVSSGSTVVSPLNVTLKL